MELIPILSTIILVATISTFLLAIGAYVLYKVRERKGQQATAAAPSTVKAELITPGETPVQQPEPVRGIPQPLFIEQEPVRVQRQPAFVRAAATQSTPRWQSQPRQFSPSYERNYEEAGFRRSREEKNSDKFYKYTSEGYVSPKEDKQSGALRWR